MPQMTYMAKPADGGLAGTEFIPDKDRDTSEVLYIADKLNHCIRKINLDTLVTSTYAGKCGIPGFKDGPPGHNRFKKPDSIGVDVYGNLYVYDEGNDYTRFIDTWGIVHTLLKGSCRERTRAELEANPISDHEPQPTMLDLKQKTVLCYRNWKKSKILKDGNIYGKPDGHILKQPGKAEWSSNGGYWVKETTCEM